jgi:hypothetical protein
MEFKKKKKKKRVKIWAKNLMLSTVVLDSHIHESPALEPWYIEHPDAPNSLCDTETHVPKAKAETFSIQHKFPHLPLYIYIYIYI